MRNIYFSLKYSYYLFLLNRAYKLCKNENEIKNVKCGGNPKFRNSSVETPKSPRHVAFSKNWILDKTPYLRVYSYKNKKNLQRDSLNLHLYIHFIKNLFAIIGRL